MLGALLAWGVMVRPDQWVLGYVTEFLPAAALILIAIAATRLSRRHRNHEVRDRLELARRSVNERICDLRTREFTLYGMVQSVDADRREQLLLELREVDHAIDEANAELADLWILEPF